MRTGLTMRVIDEPLRERLAQDAQVAAAALEDSALYAAKPITDAMISGAPRLTGQAVATIKARTALKSKDRVVIAIGPGGDRKTGGFYLVFSEYGTRFMPARPFMRPAFEAHKDEAFERFGDELMRDIG